LALGSRDHRLPQAYARLCRNSRGLLRPLARGDRADARFQANWEGAKAAGIPRGTTISPEAAQELEAVAEPASERAQ